MNSDCHFARLLTLLLFVQSAAAQSIVGEEPALGPLENRITQFDLTSGQLDLTDIRRAGLRIFATPFNHFDGFGDGPISPIDRTGPGGRPTLQNNGTFLRVNGLDAQSCLDCHGIVSAATVPVTTGVGGAGGINNSAVFRARSIDVEDLAGSGFADMDGRLINPPALFGTGGVQLVAREMTQDLLALRDMALARPGALVPLWAKGVFFGTITADATGTLDTSGVEGVDEDLVVRPFGRKGEFQSVRAFDLDALNFHMGMQPVEIVGAHVDADGDGVVNEILPGEVSALEIFITTQDSPRQERRDASARRGAKLFQSTGCADCHIPELNTKSRVLSYAMPEIATAPHENVFYFVDLSDRPMRFRPGSAGGIRVPMFSDLKRHDMGAELAESLHGVSQRRNREFITAKLWGVADTAPYLHDGRALTLNAAILLHGGEAQQVRDSYASLSVADRNAILSFLGTLRNPISPNADVLE